MRNFITIMVWAIGFAGLAQSTITYPYNPDGNADTLIGVTDLQDLLTTYGQPFLPSEILVGDSTLSSWIYQLSETVSLQQATIESLVDQLEQVQSDVWYQSWHPSIRGAGAVSHSMYRIYYHGFVAPKSGVLTHMKVRFRGSSGNAFGQPFLIGGGLYDSAILEWVVGDRFVPSSLMVQGTLIIDDIDHQIVEIEFDAPVEVEKGEVYFTALTQRPTYYGAQCAFEGIDDLLGVSGGVNESCLLYVETLAFEPSGPIFPLVASESGIEVSVTSAFWFIVD